MIIDKSSISLSISILVACIFENIIAYQINIPQQKLLPFILRPFECAKFDLFIPKLYVDIILNSKFHDVMMVDDVTCYFSNIRFQFVECYSTTSHSLKIHF